jgi:hypothetical protein
MARQLTRLVSTPPATGPAAAATAPPAVHSAMALALATGSPNACRTRAREAGSISAAALPCTTRAAISRPRLGARPQAMEATVKTDSPAANARLAPNRSEHAPADSSSAANSSV